MPSIQYFRGIRVCRVWQDSFEWRVYKPGLHLQFCSQDIWGKKKTLPSGPVSLILKLGRLYQYQINYKCLCVHMHVYTSAQVFAFMQARGQPHISLLRCGLQFFCNRVSHQPGTCQVANWVGSLRNPLVFILHSSSVIKNVHQHARHFFMWILEIKVKSKCM